MISFDEHIRNAHALGLHNDTEFHAECPICFAKASVSYRDACHTILHNKGGDPVEFDAFLSKCLVGDEFGWTFHEDPRVLVAEFLGEMP